MATCKYLFNGKSYNSYQALLNSLTEDQISGFADILFSQESKQDVVYDKLAALKKEGTLDSENTEIIDGSPDLSHDSNTFTTQTFIDSKYFVVDGKPPMFRLSTEDYVNHMKQTFVESGEYTQEGADAWGVLVQQKWKAIAENATVFHRLMLSGDTDSLYGWSQKTANTAFAGIPSEIQEAERKIFRHVMFDEGGQFNTSNPRKVLKNLNFEADLKERDEKILGHIDYLVVRDNGDIEIYNIKTSVEPVSQWAPAKMEKYRYQMALLKRMLEFHGIDSRHIRVNIVPVQIKYDSQFTAANEIRVQKPIALDTSHGNYIFTKYDSVASQFIDSTADFSGINSEALLKVTTQLQHIFPGKDVSAQGIAQSAKEWVQSNWKYCSPEVRPQGGYKLTMPSTGEVIEVSDPRKGAANEELVQIIQEKLTNEHLPFAGEVSAYRLRTDLQNAFKAGRLTNSLKGRIHEYIQTQFSKYLNARTQTADGYNYDWELISHPALDAANIIAFRHKTTGQLDVFTISNMSPDTKYSFKGRDNLLGYYLSDMNSLGFEMQCNYGNIDAIRTMALLNELAPEMGNVKLGQLKVIGLSGYHKKKGAYYEFSSLLPQWNTVVKVVNQGSPANITNNFQKYDIQCIAPEEVLRQTWVDIVDSPAGMDLADIISLGDIIDQKTRVDGSVVEGLMSMQTVEGKLEKLELLLSRLRDLCDDYGLNYKDPAKLVEASRGIDTTSAALAKLYIAAAQALSIYYGDISINNEEFSSLQEYAMKPTSNVNSHVRRVGYLTQQTIDTVRGRVCDYYIPEVLPLFRDFYKDAGYSSAQNNIIGNQAVTYKNLYQYDEEGRNTFLFKNPYDSSADLKPYEREFLKRILYEFYKVRCDMLHIPKDITGINDEKLITDMPESYLYVPLQKASAATTRGNIFSKNIGKQIMDWGRRMHRLITHPSEAYEELEGYIDSKTVKDRDIAIENMRVFNPYTRSMLNMTERDMYISEKGEAYFETNLENIFVDFLERQVQCDEFGKLLVRINGIELALTLRGDAEGDNTNIEHTLKAINDFVTVNVYNSSIMSKTGKVIEAWMKPLRRLVSLMYVSGSPVAAVRDTLQGLQENFLMSAIKYQTDVNAKDVAFGYQKVFKEGVTQLSEMTMLNQFNIKYGFSNFDAAKVAQRLKSGRHGILNADNWLYWTLRAPDYLNRLTLFVAKLHHDGAWDAYSLDENGRLVYNWRKDKRFAVYASGDKTHKDYNAQQALYYSMIRSFNMESSGKKLAYTDDLPDAYTPSQIRAIKTLGESIYGAYDKSSQAKYEQISIGRNFMFFSTWMNGIVDNYFKERQVSQSELVRVQETDYNGNPLFWAADESGNMVTEDTGKPVIRDVPAMVQGIIGTLNQFRKELANNGWNFKEFKEGEAWTNKKNRQNVKRLMTDFLIASMFAMLFKLWLTPAYKKHKAEADGRKFLTNTMLEIMYKGSATSWDTFKGPFNVLTYIGESTTPATYKLSSRVMKDAWKVVTGDKTIPQSVMGTQAFFKGMQDSYRMYRRDTQIQ